MGMTETLYDQGQRMNNEPTIPSRFQALSMPGEGLVEITDKTTGRKGAIRLACYQPVLSLLVELFPEEGVAKEQIAEAPSTTAEPVAEEAPKKKAGRPPKAKKPAAEPASAPKPPAPVEAQEVKVEAPKPKKKATPKPKAVKPKPEAAKESPQKRESAVEQEILDEGYKLVLAQEEPVISYNIITDAGDDIGTLDIEGPKKYHIRPKGESSFSESTHPSLIAAQSRLCILV